MKTSRSKHRQHRLKTKQSLKIKKAKQPYNAKRTPSFKARKVATPGTFIDTSEDLSDHDEGNKAFDKDVEEGNDDEAEVRRQIIPRKFDTTTTEGEHVNQTLVFSIV